MPYCSTHAQFTFNTPFMLMNSVLIVLVSVDTYFSGYLMRAK